MKRNILLLLSLLMATCALAQNKGYGSLSRGIVIPIGKFASKDFANKGVVKEEAFHRWWEKMTPSKIEVDSILKQKIDNGEITFTNEDGKHCAESGLTTNINGTNWKIVEDLKGNSHKFGGIDITLSDDGVSFKSNNSYIKAKHGLLIINNN